ncbi:MAG TPA: protein-export chaperone SecB [Azospirillaceae bacterium]|nr:protein-export chaperone SecB [Azospirillaceae bacterium]
MSDTTADQPSNANGEGQSRFNSLPINVLGQYVKDLSFENPNAPEVLLPGQPAPKVGVDVNVGAQPVAENVYEVTLVTRVEAKIGEKVAFLVELTYAGLFGLQGLPQEHHRPVLLIEGPRLLFPFARNIIGDVTRDGGFPPLLINPIDFADLYRRELTEEGPVGNA